jgi:hypothetical protein
MVAGCWQMMFLRSSVWQVLGFIDDRQSIVFILFPDGLVCS